ncbi:hypothetical protein OCK74_22595 [Chitinophagaceae bacterium LB-8]|jgi:hypothetical protein|uniref:Uncharacterized protein n=1 Tax=Paraflavisolibacter caeni TaxID=2982496 RepID=A0A9X2Y047_9BACT|nr:hypothetical protein [Paraflavisolibacter caeni]MCU7551927.1 hypothetical protein [Paraflavisolibacter caeni]
MKRIIFFSLLIVLFSACGKEKSIENGNNTGAFLKFKLDGQSIEYKDNVFASKDIINNQHIVIIQGQKDVSSNVPGLGIFLQDSVEITNKTYNDDGSTFTNALIYSDTAGVNYSSLYMTDASDLKVVITRIDSAYISGTFSSKVADVNANTKNITEGSFQARFQ